MNKETAREKGLSYTGVCDWDKSAVQERLEEIRRQGYKAYLVTIPPNPLSRGNHGPMYSVYTEPRYQLDQQAEETKKRLDTYDKRFEELRKRHQTELDSLGKLESEDRKWLLDHGYIVNPTDFPK